MLNRTSKIISVSIKKLADRLVTKDKLLGVSLAGILGMATGMLLIFYNDIRSPLNHQAIFHEISYDPAAIIRPIVRDSIRELEKRLEQVLSRKIFFEKAEGKKDSVERVNDMVVREKDTIVNALKVYHTYLDYTYRKDTVAFQQLNRALHFPFTPEDIDTMDSTLKEQSAGLTKEVSFIFRPAALDLEIQGRTTFMLKRGSSDVWFITGNSATGMWVLFIVTFCAVCFMVLPVCMQYLTSIKFCYGSHEHRPSYIHIYSWTLGAMLIVLLLMWLTFYDTPPVRDLYILHSLWTSLIGVMLIGYVAGAGCFTGFVYAGYRLDVLYRTAQNQAEAMAAAGDDSAKVALVPQAELKAYHAILRYFNGYFIIAAIILSLLVLCVGALYQAVNQQAFVRLLTDDWGHSPVPQHFIYLYGAVHTIMLLIFYLPTKLSFRTLMKVSAPPAGSPMLKARLKNPINKLGELVIGTLPLLASVIPPLIDFIFPD